MWLTEIWKEINNEIFNESIDKHKSYIKKVVVISSLLAWINRTKAKIYPQRIKINKEKEIIIFWVDLNNDKNIDKVYDINWGLLFFDLPEKKYEYLKSLTINSSDYVKIELLSNLVRLTYVNNLWDIEWFKEHFLDFVIDPELFNWLFSDKYITLLDFIKIVKTFDELWLDVKTKLEENIKKICKLEKEKYGTNEVCNKYKDLYKKTWKEKIKEFGEIIRKGTRKITVLWQQMYVYFYEEKELKDIKWYVEEEKYKEFMEILKERDMKFAQRVINLIKWWNMMFETKINFWDFLDNELKYEYIWKDEVKVSDGKRSMIINPFRKYIKIWNKEIWFGIDEEKLNNLWKKVESILP